jgi:hypothetical protein
MNDRVESSSGNFVQDLGDAATRNPVSAALIGMGVLWMLTGGRSLTGAGNVFRSAGFDRIPDALDAARSGLDESRESVRDTATSTLNAVRGRSASAVDNVLDYSRGMPEPRAVLGSARDSLAVLLQAQPLALGAIGLAIGAGIAAALPKTDVEDDYLGKISTTVKTRAAEIAGQQIETATTLVGDVVEAASAEASRQGLTLDDAKTAIDDITVRAGRVVDAAKSSVGEK